MQLKVTSAHVPSI